jgi:uncharacterized protein YmfQ (DUF2313 family)
MTAAPGKGNGAQPPDQSLNSMARKWEQLLGIEPGMTPEQRREAVDRRLAVPPTAEPSGSVAAVRDVQLKAAVQGDGSLAAFAFNLENALGITSDMTARQRRERLDQVAKSMAARGGSSPSVT